MKPTLSLFYQSLTLLDYAYLDDKLGVVGNSLIVDVELVGETHDDIIFDFSLAKKEIKKIIDREADHRLIVPAKTLIEKNGQYNLIHSWEKNTKTMEYWAPREAFCELDNDIISIPNIKTFLERVILKEMPANISKVLITLRQEAGESSSTFFNYTHGLKNHYGNCQRLLHGHRSMLKISVNGKIDKKSEELLANKIFGGNIHFAMLSNIINLNEIIKMYPEIDKLDGLVPSKVNLVHIKYEGPQGIFKLKIPGSSVSIFQNETTIENLTLNFAKMVKKNLNKNDTVMVQGMEGIGKGAYVTI